MKRCPAALETRKREELTGFTRKGAHRLQKAVNALNLLNCDEGKFNGHRAAGEAVAEILRIDLRKVDRVRKRFIEEGMEAAPGGQHGRLRTAIRCL